MEHYPILEIIPQLKRTLTDNQSVILQAPPGAGKSTILPLQLLGAPFLNAGKILMLEPRRLAARSVAGRMSDLLGEDTGQTVGYRVRFDARVGPGTRIEVVTEGILTRMIQSDNSLDGVGLLIFDEFHERSLHADLALALSVQIQHVLRPELRILIMSATLAGDQISAALGGAPVLTATGRQFPVHILYADNDSKSHIALLTSQQIRRALRDEAGDVLVFLPGEGEIRRTQQILLEEGVGTPIYPLFGNLQFREQEEALLPRKDGQRKIVLATSIAETSLTIEGIQTVIDSGLSRVPQFDPRSGFTRLETVRVTKDAADQRAGRAGRLGPGVCYRLWTEGTQRHLQLQRKPEILEADLAPMMLELALWGVKDIGDLTWITRPPSGAVSQATELLGMLGAIDAGGITPRGKAMLRFPTHPRIAHMLIQGDTANEKALASDIASVLEERDPLNKDAGADLSLRIETLRRWRRGDKVSADQNILERMERLAANWRSLLGIRVNNDMPAHTDTGRLTLAAYPERIARQQGKNSSTFTLANGRVAKLPDGDPLIHEPWLCVTQLDGGQGVGKIFLAASVHTDDLLPLSLESESVWWDDDREMVAAAVERRVGSLLLESRPLARIVSDASIRVMVGTIRRKGLNMLPWNPDCKMLQARIQSLKHWEGAAGWPDVSDEHLLETLEHWLSPYLEGIYKRSALEKLDLRTILTGLLPWNLQSLLEKLAPQRMTVPSGSSIGIQYFADGRAPVMEVRLQELFGLTETPVVCDGRVKILLHLLSPGYRPVQVTQDLKNFWHNTYHDVRKELRMRYPKHSWPEDPWTAVPVRGAKRNRP